MPGYDGSGPMGQGAKSGRGLGHCRTGADFFNENSETGRGVGRGGRPNGGGRGFMHGGARGNGRIRPCWRPAFGTKFGNTAAEQERTWLAGKVERVQEELQQMTERLANLESKQKTE